MGSGSINVNMKMTAQKYCQILKAVGPNNALKIDCKFKLLFQLYASIGYQGQLSDG